MNFPTSPSVGDLFTINNITYKFNNPGWEIHRTTADTITTDCGVIPFAAQSGEPGTTEGVLSLHFNNNLTDTGSGGATITHPGSNNGAPKFSTSSQYGSHSVHFDTAGGGDFLLMPYSSDLKWDGDFTVDFWLRFDAATFSLSGANYIIIVSADERTSPSPSDLGFNLGFHGSAHPTVPRSFFMSVGNSANTLRASCLINYYGLAANVSDADMQGKFNHLAICRENNVIRAWLNGIEMTQSSVTNSDSGSILTTSGTVNSYNMGMCIGRDMQFAKVADTVQTDVHDFSGYIDELRMVKGSAEFSGTTFTPPVKAHGRSPLPALPPVAEIAATPTGNICLHGDNNLNDDGSIGATVTSPGAHNSLTFDGTNKKFGTHSMFFDANSGADSFVLIPYSAELKFEGDYTIDLWVKLNTDADNNTFNQIIGPDRSAGGSSYVSGLQLSYYGVNGGNNNASWWYVSAPNSSGSGHEYGLYSDGLSEAARLSGGFHHIAIVRDSSGGRFYFNGVKLTVMSAGSLWENQTATVNPIGEPYLIGRRNNPPHTYDTQVADRGFDGWIDELRIVKGSALYISNFTPPVRAHGSSVAAISGKAQLYGKSVTSTVVGDALYHLNSNEDDAIRGLSGEATIGGTNSTQYVTPTDIGYTNTSNNWVSTLNSGGFGNSIHLDGPVGTTAQNWLEIPGVNIGTGAFSLEFFMEPKSTAANQSIFAIDDGSQTSDIVVYTATSGSGGFINVYHNHASETNKYIYWYFYWSEANRSKHWSIQRGPMDGSGKSQWSLYWDGDLISHGGSSHNGGLLKTIDITGLDFLMAKRAVNSSAMQADMYFDEIRITKSEVYSGSTYTVPTIPFSSPIPITKIYAMNSAGVESPLT